MRRKTTKVYVESPLLIISGENCIVPSGWTHNSVIGI